VTRPHDAGAVYAALDAHVGTFFEGHALDRVAWDRGPIQRDLPGFAVTRIGPGPKTDLWVYVSRGAWTASPEVSGHVEFMTLGAVDNPRFPELVTMTAHYHVSYPLAAGHTFPIGEPWLPGSLCEHVLVSRPYPFGPAFEVCNFANGHVHILWLLPITAAERELRHRDGLEALESRCERSGLEYWVPDRASVV
jgi:hypothetical protein